MNVLVLFGSIGPKGGGAELATKLYVRLLIKNGVSVRFFNTYKYLAELNPIDYSFIKIHPVIGYGKYMVASPSALNALEKAIRWSDIVYCIDCYTLMPFIKQIFKKPIVLHIHSYFPVCPVGHLYNFMYNDICQPHNRICSKCILIYEFTRRPMKLAMTSSLLNSTFSKLFLRHVIMSDAVIFVSKTQEILFKKHMIHLYDRMPKSFVIHNPLPNIKPLPMENDDVGFLGGLNPIKGFCILLYSWLRIYRRFWNVKLRMAMSKHLASIFTKFNIVKYPRLRDKGLREFYKQLRLVVVPSICPEPSPYVSIEACLYGRLLVASRIGGIPEIVGNLLGVRLIPPSDINAFANALEWALSMDKKEAIELGLRNREGILKRFNNERIVDGLIRIFERVMNS